jgi:acyl carrier protein
MNKPVSPTLNVVKSFILSEFLPGEDPENLTPTTPLMSAGILDSLATLKLIAFLEQEFNIQVQPHEADEEHFNTLERICRLIDLKR